MSDTVDLDAIRKTSERLYHADFLDRMYLAEYVAQVDFLCDEVEQLRARLGLFGRLPAPTPPPPEPKPRPPASGRLTT